MNHVHRRPKGPPTLVCDVSQRPPTIWMEKKRDGVFEVVEPSREWVARVRARKKRQRREAHLLNTCARFLKGLLTLQRGIYGDAPFDTRALDVFLRCGGTLNRVMLPGGSPHPILVAALRRHAWILQRLPAYLHTVCSGWRSRFSPIPEDETDQLRQLAEELRDLRRTDSEAAL